MELSSPQSINKPVEQWYADEDMKKMTLLEGVLHKQLWEYVPLLIQNGVDLDHCSESYHETILHKVIWEEVPPEVVAQLITPTNINCQTKFGCTPLHDAVITQLYYLIPVLIQHGADINIAHSKWKTPLHLILSGGKMKLKDLDDTTRRDVLSQLISNKNINAAISQNKTPLHLVAHMNRCASKSHWDNLQLLVEHGALVNNTDVCNNVPLYYCIQHVTADLPVVRMMMPDDPIQKYKVLVQLLLYPVDDGNQWFQGVKCLLEHLPPLQLTSVELDAKNNLNVNCINIKELTQDHKSVEKALYMICHLLQGTCLTRQLTVAVDAKHDGESYVERLYEMEETVNSKPPSLTKLAVLNIRQYVMYCKNSSNYTKIGLPGRLESLLKYEPLALELQQMWSVK